MSSPFVEDESRKSSHRLGVKYFEQKKFQFAEKEFQGVLAQRNDTLGQDHADALESKYMLARSLYEQRKYGSAETLFRQVFLEQERSLGQDSTDTTATKYWFARSLFNVQKYKDAEQYFQQGIEEGEKAYPQGHFSTSDNRHWLGRSIYSQYRHDEAERVFHQAVQERQRLSGQDHPKTLCNKYWLGLSLYSLRRYDHAEDVFRQTAQGREKRTGTNSVETIAAKHWLARSLYEQREYGEAESCFRQAVLGREAKLGHNSLDTTASKFWLARSLYDQQKYAEAEKYFQEAAQGEAKTLGEDHNTTIDSKTWQARALSQQQQQQQHTDTTNASLQEGKPSTTPDPITPSDSENSTPEMRCTTMPCVSIKPHPCQPTSTLDEFFTENQSEEYAYSDAQIAEISSLLEHLHPQWSKVPRTYIVLRTIKCLNVLDDLISSGFSDYWFPATATNPPPLLRPSQVLEFINTQHLVLTKALDLERRADGRHCYFDKGEYFPLETQRILGQGGYGQVDEVLSLVSYKKYARKRVLRRAILRGQKPENLHLFVREIEIMKRLNHKHIVEFVGSYSDTKYLGLLMHPVAQTDLSGYLTGPDVASRSGELRTFFGCLVTALDYLHTQCIRHKDIKPQNILVNRGNVMLTDFGLSHDFADAQGSTTMSMVNGLTPRYCAPEVVLSEPRDTSSDIWSLGIVFLEMLVVLKGQTVAFMDQCLLERGSRLRYVRDNRSGFLELLVILQETGEAIDNKVIGWIRDMVQQERDSRPTARSLLTTISNSSKESSGANKFCGICCLLSDDDDEFSSDDEN